MFVVVGAFSFNEPFNINYMETEPMSGLTFANSRGSGSLFNKSDAWANKTFNVAAL